MRPSRRGPAVRTQLHGSSSSLPVVRRAHGLSNFNMTVAYPAAGRKGAKAPIRNNRFKLVFKGSPDVEDDKRTVAGRFNGSKVTGTIEVEGVCSGGGKYSAKR